MLRHTQHHQGCSQCCCMPNTTKVAAKIAACPKLPRLQPTFTKVAANIAACPTPPTLRPTLQHAQHHQRCGQHYSMPNTTKVAANIAACPTPSTLRPTLQHAQHHQGCSQHCSMPNTTKVAANQKLWQPHILTPSSHFFLSSELTKNSNLALVLTRK